MWKQSKKTATREERIEGLEKEGDPEVFGMYKVLKMMDNIEYCDSE